MLWHLQIEPAAGRADLEGQRIAAEAADLGLPGPWRIAASRGFLVEGPLTPDDLRRAAAAVLVDPVVETFTLEASQHPARRTGYRRPRAAPAGRDRPRGPERPGRSSATSASRPRTCGRSGPTASRGRPRPCPA